MKIHQLVCLSLFGIMIHSCAYNNEADLYPSNNDTLDTSKTFTYSGDVVPILNRECTSCHNQNNISGGIQLDNYDDVKFFANNGRLLGSIEWSSGFSPMPKGGPKMPANDITRIKKWIEGGALNN
jgi:hypothetical protein